MTDPLLRALTESGAVWLDPSGDLMFELLRDVERGDETWFIVERVADATGQTYIQVIRDGHGGWTVERREGRPERHFAVTRADLRLAHETLTTWAFGLQLVPPPGEWTTVTLQT